MESPYCPSSSARYASPSQGTDSRSRFAEPRKKRFCRRTTSNAYPAYSWRLSTTIIIAEADRFESVIARHNTGPESGAFQQSLAYHNFESILSSSSPYNRCPGLCNILRGSVTRPQRWDCPSSGPACDAGANHEADSTVSCGFRSTASGWTRLICAA